MPIFADFNTFAVIVVPDISAKTTRNRSSFGSPNGRKFAISSSAVMSGVNPLMKSVTPAEFAYFTIIGCMAYL